MTIFDFLGKSSKINFWLVLGVTGKSGSQEMSVFLVFEHFENFEILKNVPGGPEARGPKRTGLGALKTRLETLRTGLGILKTGLGNFLDFLCVWLNFR